MFSLSLGMTSTSVKPGLSFVPLHLLLTVWISALYLDWTSMTQTEQITIEA